MKKMKFKIGDVIIGKVFDLTMLLRVDGLNGKEYILTVLNSSYPIYENGETILFEFNSVDVIHKFKKVPNWKWYQTYVQKKIYKYMSFLYYGFVEPEKDRSIPPVKGLYSSFKLV